MDIKEAIGTSVLSSRWRFIWTSMPYLNFSTHHFPTLPKFSKFVTRVLSGRNNLTQVYSVNLNFHENLSPALVKRILNYASSHNIQQLNVVVCFLEDDMQLPLYLFSSKSLKHLSLTMQIGRQFSVNRCLTSTWGELPALTTLDLHHVTLCDANADKCVAIFSKCPNLKNLTLNQFATLGSVGFRICHPRLSNLTLEKSDDSVKVLKVAAPQLKNLTIKSCYAVHMVSAPDLASLRYHGSRPLYLSTHGFHSLEKADICVSNPDDADANEIVCLLQQLHNVHFLTLNLEIVELLSSFVILQPSPFVNLKRLKIYPEKKCWSEQAPKKVAMSTELKSYLLDSSPKCIFTMVLREEIEAQKIMAKLGVILEKEKDSNKTNKANLELGEVHVAESHKPKKLKLMARINNCWENLGVQVEEGKEKVGVIVSKLQRMEELLIRMPASNRAKIQPCFNSLSVEADIAISKILK